MSRQLARDLYHLMRRASRRTPVENLKRRGHKTVSVLNFRDVEHLIQRAVDNTLRRRGLNLEGPEIHEEVRLEFLALMRERDVLRDTVDQLLAEKDELQENRHLLQVELTRTTEEFETEQEAVVEGPAADLDQIMRTVETRLRDLLTSRSVASGTIAEVIRLVTEIFEEQRQAILRRTQEVHDERLDNLKRRINRLKHKLQETEEMLWKARLEGGQETIEGEHVIPGVKFGDPNYQTKKELLGEIFRLNVELREMLKKN